jgi:hypothetical protein
MKLFKNLMIFTMVGMNGFVNAGISKKVSELIEQSKGDEAKLAQLQTISALLQQGNKESARAQLKELLGKSSSSSRASSPILSLDKSDEELESSESSNPFVTAVMPIPGMKRSIPLVVPYNSPAEQHYVDQFRMQSCEVQADGSESDGEWVTETVYVDPSLSPSPRQMIERFMQLDFNEFAELSKQQTAEKSARIEEKALEDKKLNN